MHARSKERKLDQHNTDATAVEQSDNVLFGEQRKRGFYSSKVSRLILECVEFCTHLALPQNLDLKWSKGVELGMGLVESCVYDDETYCEETVPVRWAWWGLRRRRWWVISRAILLWCREC
jgi:hypothetical protein